MTIERIIRLT